jgi:hypothetical protein
MRQLKHLSVNTRKSLCIHINEKAGTEVADVIESLLARIDHLERTKVDVTPIAPDSSRSVLKARRAA